MSIDLISAPDPEVGDDASEPEVVVAVSLVCRTEGCANEGIPITMEIPVSTSYAYCGPCGQRITEYTEEGSAP